mgnify:CR=1 FL=1
MLGMYLADVDIREEWLVGGVFVSWADFKTKILDYCDFDHKISPTEPISS